TEQLPIAMEAVQGGEKITIDVVEVTGMAMHVSVVFLDPTGR
ncbi:hypothetical protein LCGC14_2272290, partial [marine sediment metagenome]